MGKALGELGRDRAPDTFYSDDQGRFFGLFGGDLGIYGLYKVYIGFL